MPESAKVQQSVESFKAYLSEAIQGKTAILIGEDKNIYLAGVIGIVLEITHGIIPLFIGRSAIEIANIQTILKDSKADYLTIFDSKHNLTDDEPRGEQLVFDWKVNENGQVTVKSSYSLVGEVKHRGFQS